MCSNKTTPPSSVLLLLHSFKQELTQRLYQILHQCFWTDLMEKNPSISVLKKNLLFEITIPPRQFGDYATNIAMAAAGMVRQPPMKIATTLQDAFKWEQIIDTLTVVPPGFVNLHLHDSFREQILLQAANDFSVLFPSINTKQSPSLTPKILLEYVSANPTGPLHIGHGRWAAIGNTLANILEKRGHSVTREFYVNDTGNQINKLYQSVKAVRENKPIDTDGYHGDYLMTFKNNDADPIEYLLDEQKTMLSNMNIHFDSFFRESKLHSQKAVPKTLQLLTKKGFTYTHEKALWLKTTLKGDDKDRVLIKSDGSYTYFAVDIAYHHDKINRKYPILIDVLGADHHGYIKRLQAAIRMLTNGQTTLHTIIGQLVQFVEKGKSIKMSKRKGDMVLLQDVYDDIGKDATLYYLTMRSANSPLEFNLQQAKEKNNENPLYYVQYAHARLCSLLAKATSLNILSIEPHAFEYHQIKSPEVDELTAMILQYPQELQSICESYEIHHLNVFLHKTAGCFHRLYNKQTFIDPHHLRRTSHYLYFLRSFHHLFRDGLKLLGISAPETM